MSKLRISWAGGLRGAIASMVTGAVLGNLLAIIVTATDTTRGIGIPLEAMFLWGGGIGGFGLLVGFVLGAVRPSGMDRKSRRDSVWDPHALFLLVLGCGTPYLGALVGWYLILGNWNGVTIASARTAVTVCVFIPLGVYGVICIGLRLEGGIL